MTTPNQNNAKQVDLTVNLVRLQLHRQNRRRPLPLLRRLAKHLAKRLNKLAKGLNQWAKGPLKPVASLIATVLSDSIILATILTTGGCINVQIPQVQIPGDLGTRQGNGEERSKNSAKRAPELHPQAYQLARITQVSEQKLSTNPRPQLRGPVYAPFYPPCASSGPHLGPCGATRPPIPQQQNTPAGARTLPQKSGQAVYPLRP